MRALFVSALGIFVFQSAVATPVRINLLNGTIVPKSDYPQVVMLREGKQQQCSATIVGERVVVTAAHCIPDDGSDVNFNFAGKNYTVSLTAQPAFGPTPEEDFDIAAGLVDRNIVGVTPLSIGGTAKIGTHLELVGFGCHLREPRLVWDGKKRQASVTVTGYEYPNLLTDSPKRRIACEGDSGGAAILEEGGIPYLHAVMTASDDDTETVSCRLDIPENQKFLADFADDNQVDICGINKDCERWF